MNLETVGLRIAKIRSTKGISARELSFQLGKNGGYMYKVETGKFNVGLRTLFEICEILDIDITELFNS